MLFLKEHLLFDLLLVDLTLHSIANESVIGMLLLLLSHFPFNDKKFNLTVLNRLQVLSHLILSLGILQHLDSLLLSLLVLGHPVNESVSFLRGKLLWREEVRTL